jgi:hypothetical protein
MTGHSVLWGLISRSWGEIQITQINFKEETIMKKFPVAFMVQFVLAILLFGVSDGISASNKWNPISTPELKAMMDKGEDMLLVCTLPQIIYDVKHIKGSVGIPLGKIKTSPDMPKDKGKRIIFYCLGPA